jgi:RimJ/RimL family protein N-acetyltransferase
VPTIRLEPFADAHVEAFEALLDDPEVQRFTRLPVPPPAGYPAAWLDRYRQGRLDGTREAFAIVDGSRDGFLGVALAVHIDREAQTAELGYIVAAEARGRGVASEALRRLTEWTFADLGALRVELWISVANDGSKRVAARCGYIREGVLRSIHFKGDERDDFEIWSRLPTDP